jgi:hypothetical protein
MRRSTDARKSVAVALRQLDSPMTVLSPVDLSVMAIGVDQQDLANAPDLLIGGKF